MREMRCEAPERGRLRALNLAIDLALVPYRESHHFVLVEAKAVLREIAGATAKDDELASVHVYGAPDEWVVGQDPDPVEDDWNRLRPRPGIRFAQEVR